MKNEDTNDCNVAKLVGTSDSVVIHDTGCGDPSRVGIVGENNKLVLLTLVPDGKNGFLDIPNVDSVSNSVD